MASPPDSVSSGLDGSSEGTSSVPSQGPSLGDQATIQGGRAGARTFSPGQVVADRYRIVGSLGEGGMGEVWHAFDLKLRVDVALKTLIFGSVANEKRIEALRREVRSARDVVSPGVCRVFDLHEIDGQELVSMEFVDGDTLTDVLRSRGPLDLGEASEIASQFLAGLSAIHDAGLVHRDIKPENIMITRAGRVVIMDFGLAKLETEGSHGTVSGTPAYMPPEQRRGEAVDARADIFAAGVVLAEMLATDKAKPIESRKSLLTGVHQSPPRIPEGPWHDVLTRAVSADPNDRYRSASTLARALEEVTLRVDGAEDKKPYPGLASFTEEDAEYFFGREEEVESIWKRFQQPHLLGLIGPSGAGKSSFLRAGLIAHKRESWKHVICHPGDAPFRSLAKALVPELAGDTKAMQQIVHFDEPDTAVDVVNRWRRNTPHALVILDQFEELFTLNPPETQQRFADLIGRMPIEANVHVLLSMRDDFLFHCSEFPSLAPVFSELSPLRALTTGSLRRALVQPALLCGYRFEDESLVDEMIGEVSDERGALPLLAFAASRLWETRDRETGTLTREAYEEIGGVAGALAQHAEATMERLGEARRDTVREIFRNLVTAEGTRAVREMDELLSVFENREAAREVLTALIDARLLTSYEVTGVEDEESRHQIEIVHESLLDAWPRLVRWRTQDEDSAQLRDQLRQAAKMWEERGRSEDLLWSGSAYFDYRAWRERYPGGLSDTEEAFADAMVSKANRQRRRRQVVAGVAFVVLAVVLSVVGWLWRKSERSRVATEAANQRSEAARQEAVQEALRAEASKLLTLGRLVFDSDPSSALAYALASLELADLEEARMFTMKALWRGPTAIRWTSVDKAESKIHAVAMSPDAEWLFIGSATGTLEILSKDGTSLRSLEAHQGVISQIEFLTPGIIATWAADRKVKLWSVPSLDPIRTLPLEGAAGFRSLAGRNGEPGILTAELTPTDPLVRVWKWWPAPEGSPTILGTTRSRPNDRGVTSPMRPTSVDVDTVRRRLIYSVGNRIFAVPLDNLKGAPELVGSHSTPVKNIAVSPKGRFAASTAIDGREPSLWSLDPPYRRLPLAGEARAGLGSLAFSPDESWLAATGLDRFVYLWDLTGPPESEPIVLNAGPLIRYAVDFSPDGRWLLTSSLDGFDLWPLGRDYARTLRGLNDQYYSVRVGPEQSWIAASGISAVEMWSGRRDENAQKRTLFGPERAPLRLAMDPAGEKLIAGFDNGEIILTDLRNGAQWTSRPFSVNAFSVAASPSGNLIAAGGGQFTASDAFIHLWNLETGQETTLDPGHGKWIMNLAFDGEDRLFEAGPAGLAVWDLSTEERSVVHPGTVIWISSGPRRDSIAYVESAEDVLRGSLRYVDLSTREALPIAERGVVSIFASADAGQTLISVDPDWNIHVGRWNETRTHILSGHQALVMDIRESPDGARIFSASLDGTIRIWPMPDVNETPFHLLPREELIARIKALTNVRIVADDDAPNGYRIELAEFPGWERVPTW